MAETNDNINDLIEQITCNMLLSDVTYNNVKEDKAKRKAIYDAKREQTVETIKSVCRIVEKELPEGPILSFW